MYSEGVEEYEGQDFAERVKDSVSLSTMRTQSVLVTLKNGTKQLVGIKDYDMDREPDALTEAVSDYTDWAREKDLAETIFPDGELDTEIVESYVMVEFFNIRPDFSKDADLDEAQAALLSSTTWITHLNMRSNGWDRNGQSDSDITFDKKIREMTKHMHFGVAGKLPIHRYLI